MSPLVSPRTYDLSEGFRRLTIRATAGTFLTGRTFYEIHLYEAVLLVCRTMIERGGDEDERSVLVETLKAVCSDTREHKLLVIDDVRVSLSFEDWASVFSTLRYDQSSLEAISVECTGMIFCAFCSQIGYVLAESSTLEILWFGYPLEPYDPGYSLSSRDISGSQPRISDEVVKTISEGLVQSRSLRGLGLSTLMLEREFADVLKSAFTANVQNTSLEWIDLPAHLERLDMVLEALLLSNSYKNLKRFQLTLPGRFDNLVTEHTVDNFQTLAEYLRRWERSDFDTSLREVVLKVTGDEKAHKSDQSVLSCWDKWVSATECSALMLKTHLQIVNTSEGWGWLISEMLERFTHLKSLQLSVAWTGEDCKADTDQISFLCRSLQSADSVESISILGSKEILENFYPSFFRCLQHKRRLKGLSLDGILWKGEVFSCLMDLLHVNIYLEEVELLNGEWTAGISVIVQAALRRNREQAAYFSTLRDAELPFEEGRAARVFLCGQPHAGKTTLRVTMMKTRHNESRIVRYCRRKFSLLWEPESSNKALPLKRTKGVDVELLRDDKQMQVSIWDLAGQEIFRALQSLLLPTVTQACVFVFVFSPFEDDQCRIKEELEVSFKLELRSWLRFVASHYPFTGTFLPEVLVIITHKDKMKQYGRDLGREWREIVDIFRREYGEVLNLDATPWHVNAWNEKDINPFVEKLCTHVSKLLSKNTPQAPSACCKLISEILDPKHPSSSQMLAKPVWNIQDFYAYISKRLEALHIGSFDQSLVPQRRVLNAMIRYMHDVGSIFYLSECQLVVGDINWLTHKFLGVLISEGHGFHSKLLPGEFSSRDGTVTKGTLETILKELSEIRWRKKVTVDPQVLEDLLVNLDLCYPVGDVGGVQGYFMPTIVGRKNARVQDLTRWGTAPSSSEADWQYFGYRLLCADRRTSLTSATFPRFQIRFRKDMEANGETCILQRDVIRLDRKGYSIIVENAEEETHIDVLFQFSKRTSRDEATLYVRERILQEFRKFCTSPEGCRGVTLETAIIRPECVQRLTPQKYRKEQIILESELKDLFSRAVSRMQEKFNAGQVMWSRGDKEGDIDLFNYEHFWKEVPEAALYKDSQLATELLSGIDVVKIMEPVKEENRITAEQLVKVEQQLDSHLQQSTDGGVGMLSATQDSWSSEEGSSSHTQEDKKFNDLHKHLDRMEERLKEHVDKRVLSIRMDIQQLQERVTSSLLCIMTKLDTMVGYSRALEDARVPRLPFISFTDVQFHQRIKSVLQIGTPVRLHLMCESRFRPHSVLGQPGLSLTIGEENKEWLRCISVNALKIVWTVLKLGVDSQLPGVGALIPELGDLSSGLVQMDRMTLDELKDAKLDSLPRVEGSETVKNMWRFLERILPREKIPKDFKLQLVRYNPGIVAANQAYAWLCQTCIDEGEKNNVLKSI